MHEPDIFQERKLVGWESIHSLVGACRKYSHTSTTPKTPQNKQTHTHRLWDTGEEEIRVDGVRDKGWEWVSSDMRLCMYLNLDPWLVHLQRLKQGETFPSIHLQQRDKQTQPRNKSQTLLKLPRLELFPASKLRFNTYFKTAQFLSASSRQPAMFDDLDKHMRVLTGVWQALIGIFLVVVAKTLSSSSVRFIDFGIC